MNALPRFWQFRHWRACLLLPVSSLFALLLRIRRWSYRSGLSRTVPSALPVIVVGNLSVGGTGKTPLCAELVKRFQLAGWSPAIVSRGYGGPRHETAHLLSPADTPATAGDEPVMLYQQTGVPVCVCIDRAAAVEKVARDTHADIVFSDDGLQHLRMARVADIIVIDGARGLGNRWVMPAGPLREPPRQLALANLIAIQDPFTGIAGEGTLHHSLPTSLGRYARDDAESQTFQLRPGQVRQVQSGQIIDLSSLKGRPVHAVAGIGNPQRFFDSLAACDLQIEPHPFPDHHQFTHEDLSFADGAPVLLTSKDAVKVKAMSDLPDTVYEVATQIHVSDALSAAIDALERSLRSS